MTVRDEKQLRALLLMLRTTYEQMGSMERYKYPQTEAKIRLLEFILCETDEVAINYVEDLE